MEKWKQKLQEGSSPPPCTESAYDNSKMDDGDE